MTSSFTLEFLEKLEKDARDLYERFGIDTTEDIDFFPNKRVDVEEKTVPKSQEQSGLSDASGDSEVRRQSLETIKRSRERMDHVLKGTPVTSPPKSKLEYEGNDSQNLEVEEEIVPTTADDSLTLSKDEELDISMKTASTSTSPSNERDITSYSPLRTTQLDESARKATHVRVSIPSMREDSFPSPVKYSPSYEEPTVASLGKSLLDTTPSPVRYSHRRVESASSPSARFSHSPKRPSPGVTFASSEILRSVLGRAASSPPRVDCLNKSSPHEKATKLPPPPVPLDPANRIPTLNFLPSPSTARPDDRAMYYVDYLRHRRHEVRFGAAESIYQIILQRKSAVNSVADKIVAGVLSSLEFYANQERKFNIVVVEILRALGPVASPAIKILLRMLIDESIANDDVLQRKVVRCLFRLGRDAVEAIADVASKGNGPQESRILTELANHPRTISHVIVPALMRDCKSEQASRRTAAVIALGKLGEHAAGSLSLLVNMVVLSSVDRFVSVGAIRALGIEGEGLLIKLLTESRSHRVRAAAAYGISIPRRLGGGSQQLKVIVETDVVNSVAFGPEFVFYSSEDEDMESITFDRRELIISLRRAIEHGEFDKPEPSEYIPDEPTDDDKNVADNVLPCSMAVVTALVSALEDPEPGARSAAAVALGQIRPANAAQVCRYMVKVLRDPVSKVREVTAESLRLLGCSDVPEMIPQLTELLKDEFYKVRFSACRTLGSFGEASESAIPALMKLLRDGTLNRNEVARAICMIGSAGESTLLRILLSRSRESPSVRVSAAFGLSFADTNTESVDKVTEQLFAASKDPLPAVRKAVIETLSTLARKSKKQSSVTYLESSSFLPLVYTFLKDKDRSVRWAASEIIAQCGSHGELLLIEGVLKDSSVAIRQAAAHGLKIVGPRAIRTLLLGLNDHDHTVRHECSQTMMSFGIESVIDVLRSRPVSQRESVSLSIKEAYRSGFPPSPKLSAVLKKILDSLSRM